jgi:hypothetical protein
MEISIFKDITCCLAGFPLAYITLCFSAGDLLCLLSAPCRFLACFITLEIEAIAPKRLWAFTGIHGVIFQKIGLFKFDNIRYFNIEEGQKSFSSLGKF